MKRARSRCFQNQERLRLAARVFEASPSGILVTDAQCRIVDVNPALEVLTGYSKAELLGQNPRVFSSGRQNAEFYQRMYDSLQRHRRWEGEVWNRCKSGAVYVCRTSITPVTNAAGEVEHYVAVYADISALLAQRDQLSSLAHFDALTGLPNRRLLDDRLQQAIASAQRNGTQLAVCLVDLDGFKAVNDRHGHAEGDALLVEVAGRMQQIIRAEETLARLGGDEFVLVLLDGDVFSALERLLEVVRTPVSLRHGGAVQVTASVGVSRYRPGVEDGAQLLREADGALYRVKAAGKDAWGIFDGASDQPQALEVKG